MVQTITNVDTRCGSSTIFAAIHVGTDAQCCTTNSMIWRDQICQEPFPAHRTQYAPRRPQNNNPLGPHPNISAFKRGEPDICHAEIAGRPLSTGEPLRPHKQPPGHQAGKSEHPKQQRVIHRSTKAFDYNKRPQASVTTPILAPARVTLDGSHCRFADGPGRTPKS